MHNNLSMLMLPEKSLIVKLYYQNGESATLQFYRHWKGIERGKGSMTGLAAKRMISKFEAKGCSDNKPRCG